MLKNTLKILSILKFKFGDSHGNIVHLHERDCSVQRRNQKVIEIAPAVGLSPEFRNEICEAAVKLCKMLAMLMLGRLNF